MVTLSGHPLPAVLQQGAPGELLLDGRAVQHLAVATNRAGEGLALLQRHRAKAACFRLNGLTYNLLTALKRLTPPGDFRTARPKRLRFLPFNTVGKVVHHARRTLLRLTGAVRLALMTAVRQRRAIPQR